MARLPLLLVLLLSLATLPAVGWADEQPPARAPLRLAAQAVADIALENVRGGSGLTDAGLQIALTIRRDVQIGSATANDGGLGAVAGSTGASLSSLTLVQRGSGNAFVASSIGAAAAATVVQNTLDNQQIRAVTTIDVQATSLQAYRAGALQATLGNAITASLRR